MAFDDLIADADSIIIETLGGADAAQYVSADGSEHPLAVIFDENYQSVTQGEAETKDTRPYAFARIVDLPGAGARMPNTQPNGDTLIIAARTFRIVNYEKAGAGGIRLYLQDGAG